MDAVLPNAAQICKSSDLRLSEICEMSWARELSRKDSTVTPIFITRRTLLMKKFKILAYSNSAKKKVTTFTQRRLSMSFTGSLSSRCVNLQVKGKCFIKTKVAIIKSLRGQEVI